MFENLFVPVGTLLHMTVASVTDEHVRVDLAAMAPAMPCPRCCVLASRIHSRYQRTLADVPMIQRPVVRILHVRRFFCNQAACPQRTFCERLPDLVAAGARRTTRLRTEQRRLGLEVGGEAGARLAQRQGMPVSPATLLRLARRAPLPVAPTPRVLGVDDFSLRKGQVFGTILVDLERRQPIDRLPDRTSDSLATWLEQHPGVEIISRDRATEYADGATRGAPAAVQIADRFHLLQNLREALQRVLEQQVAAIAAAHALPTEPIVPAAAEQPALTEPLTVAASADPLAGRSRRERLHAESRACRHVRYTQVRALARQGASIHAIARQLELSRQTVRRLLRADQFPEQGQRRPQRSKLDPFVPYLRDQLATGNDNAAALWRVLRDQHGYTGGRSQVTQWIANHRQLCPPGAGTVRRGRPPATQPPPPPTPRRRSARQVSWLFMRPFDRLDAEGQQVVERLTQAVPALQTAYTCGTSFMTMVKTRDYAAYDGWISAAEQSGIGALQSFAVGLERDGAAVRAALRLPWSNGHVEGQVNHLKRIKRMAYGRAKFDLLRQRVLAA